MNVCMEYLYRDAANYKSWGEVVFRNEGNLDTETIDARIRAALIDGEFFIAEKVEVPLLYFAEYDHELDHQWHQYSSISPSNDPVTDNRDVIDIIAVLKAVQNEPYVLAAAR